MQPLTNPCRRMGICRTTHNRNTEEQDEILEKNKTIQRKDGQIIELKKILQDEREKFDEVNVTRH